MSRWRELIASALPMAAACSFPDVAYGPDDAQPMAAASTGLAMQPAGIDAGDAPDPQGVHASTEGGAIRSGPSNPSHDAGALDAGKRDDSGVDCLCDAGQLYPSNVDCSALKLVNLGVLCSDTAGFVGSDPGCGHAGAFVTCAAGLGLACMRGTTSVVTQQCH
jgi:hypothetical protein